MAKGKRVVGYLHVTVKKKGTENWLCIFKDLSVSDLKKKLVKPYRLGKSIFYDGKILSPSDITQIKIIETSRPHEEELKIVQEESFKEIQDFNRKSTGVILISAGYGYSDHEINECGSEVTESYISSGPGIGTPLTVISDFIKHPWVVRVVGGLVFVTVVTYAGLNSA